MVTIEKILLTLTYVTLNLGLYILFLSPLKNRFNKLIKGVFAIMFILICALIGILKGASNPEFIMSLSLMAFYMISYIVFRVAVLSLKSQGKKINKHFFSILTGVVAVLGTIVQILNLYGL